MPVRRRHRRCASPRYVLDLLSFVRNPKARSRHPAIHWSLMSHPMTLRFTCVTSCVWPLPPPSFPVITQNPSGVLTAYASGHVGMLGREFPPLLSFIRIRSRRTCAATYTHDLSSPSTRQESTLVAWTIGRNAWTRPTSQNFAAATNSQPW